MELALMIIGVALLFVALAGVVGLFIRGGWRAVLQPERLNVLLAACAVVGVVLGLYAPIADLVRDRTSKTENAAVTPSVAPTSTSIPVSSPTPSPTPNPTPSVMIVEPRDGDSVPVGATVEGKSSAIAAGQFPDSPPPWIFVLVLPKPGDPNQSWWVQLSPLVRGDGGWDAHIFVGQTIDPPGTRFEICAIVSRERLEAGRYGGDLPPAITRDCVSVTR